MMKTLQDSRDDWASAIQGDGGYCPCCDRWGKIYPRHFNSSDDPKVKHSGMWRATSRGVDFAHGLITIPQTVFTYNAEVMHFGEEDMRIGDAFETHFDYAKVMLPVSRPQLGLWGET